jgi:lactoylglutathione lyase
LQQIAVGGLEKEPLTNLWVNIFGLSKVDSFVSASENVDEDVLSLGEPPYAVEVDLMTPLDPEKSPKVRRHKLHPSVTAHGLYQHAAWSWQLLT